jgi:hypothetical protein
MRAIVVTAAIAFASVSAALAKTSDVMATVRQYIDYFNKTDLKGMAARCAWPASILNGLPPHSWQGPTACVT